MKLAKMKRGLVETVMINFEEHGVCFTRLLDEYKEHGKLIIAFDFDNTVFDYHYQGLNTKRAEAVIAEAYRMGHEVYCFTANNDHALVKHVCLNKLGFEPTINESSLDYLFESRKPFYSLLLDDRAGLQSSIKLLEQLNEHIKTYLPQTIPCHNGQSDGKSN